MKELKFRAWTGTRMEYKIMAGFLGAFYVQGMDAEDKACMSPFNTIYPEQTPIMQYTGLHDKNGKKVYDNDLLKEIDQFGRIYQVKWFDNGWSLSIEPFHNRHFKDAENMEIIGNIYENPELLKL